MFTEQESIMRSKFLAGAAALAVIAGAVMASSTPAAAWRNRDRAPAPGPLAAVGAATGAVLGGVAAATSPWWWGGYGYYPYYNYYGYAPGYDYGYSAPTSGWQSWGFGANGYPQPPWNGSSGNGIFGSFGNGNFGYVAPGRDQAWCESHYRSYNPATGMFLGYDGRYHPCP
jgi:BA14K-like protein